MPHFEIPDDDKEKEEDMPKLRLIGLNNQRAEWARKAVDAFAAEAGTDGLETDIGDLLIDLRHLCDKEGLDWEKIADKATRYFDMEKSICQKCGVSYDNETNGDEEHCEGCLK